MTKKMGWIVVAAAGSALLMGNGASIAQTPDAAPQPTPTAATPTTTAGGTIHGSVKAGSVPLPGVAITATNTLTGKKYATTTDVDGNYAMTIPKTGRYVVRAELAAFAPITHEVRITAEAADQPAEFAMQLASRVAAQTQAAGQQAASGAAATLRILGTQALSMASGETGLEDSTAGTANTGAVLPSLARLGDASRVGDASDSVAVSGQQGTTNPLANMSEDQLRDRMNNVMDQVRVQGGLTADQQTAVVTMLGGILGGGGFGGPGGGGPGGGGGRGSGGGGAFRNFNPAQPHGSIFYQGGNSALNSAPWSPTLKPLTNPSAYSNRFGVSLAGTPYIPGLTKPDTRQFIFINLTGQKNLNAFLPNPVRVPTVLERAGDFSQSFQEVNGVLTPVSLIDPKTGLPIAGNNLANSTVGFSPAALALLNYYPACNINCRSTDPTVYNFQTISNAGSNNVAINSRYQRQLGKATPGGPFGRGGGGPRGQRQSQNAPPVLRQNINASYNYSHSANDNRNIFLPLGGATFSNGYALNFGYVISYGRLSNNASISWNRSSGQGRNYFTDTANNPTASAGIAVPNQASTFADPRFYNGLPAIGITNFAGLSNQTPSATTNQTISFSDFVAWRRKTHNFRFGVDIRRVHADSIGGQNPLGRLQFTGFATNSAFADFLLGLPQTTSIQAGLNKIYLRENVFDVYANDDYRVTRNVTLNYGIRYEYFAPYTEKNNHLVNLDPNSTFTAVDTVTPGANSKYNGTYPGGLVNPDRTMFAPRFGGAYSPKFKWTKNLVIRGGYGINYNTGQYASFAKSMSFQPPFAVTQTNVAPTATTAGTSGCVATTKTTTANITLANGFGCATGNTIQNNFSVDKNYRLGMVQVFNLNVQKTIGASVVLNIGYNGSKGSNLDITGSPNTTPAGTTISGVSAFNYETSVAGSHSNQLAVSLQQRQKKGIALGATYSYSHAIDNASSIGGGGESTVQNFYRLDLEEANSSFDQRHLLSGTWLLELPFGPNREFLNKDGFWAKALDGFSLSGSFNFGTGNYFTPQYSGTIAQAASGGNYVQRPNRDFTQSTKGPGKLTNFFNAAAFTAPTITNGVTQYGTASRNSIEGPGTISTNAVLSKTIAMKGTQNFEARVTANNVFNTVQYSGINTTLNSQTYGQVTSAAGMRSLQVQARYRF